MKKFLFAFFLFISSNSQAEILFQDPTGKELNSAFNNLSEQEIKNISAPDINKKKYMLGLLYLNGDEAFHVEQNCQKAVTLLTGAWDANIADAGHALATMYYHGVCINKDIGKARDLATKTGEEGYILSQRMLGMSYIGEKWEDLYPHDIRKGIFWLSKAGNAGDRESAGQLSYIYRNGEGVPQDDKKSFLWLKKGVFNKFEKDNMVGFRQLANSYEKGIGTKIDLVKAYKYYDLYGTAGADGKQRVAEKMTQKQINEATQESQEWQQAHNIETGSSLIRRID